MTPLGSSHQFESCRECDVQFAHFTGTQSPHVSGQDKLGQARQLAATDSGVVFHSLFRSNIDLSRNSEPLRKYGSTNDGRKVRLYQPAPADHHIHPLSFWIESVRLRNQIQIAALHLVEVGSVLKYVFDFPFEIFRVGIHNLEIPRASIFGRGKPEVPSRGPFQKPRPIGIGLVNLDQQFFREQN
jgi:hypothetical protein